MELQRAQRIAENVIERLRPYCLKIGGYWFIEVAGSVRRKKTFVNDIDLVLIPADRYAVDRQLMELGTVKMAGKKIARVEMDSITLDVYYATPETWATLFLIRTGSTQSNIRLASLAKKRGWRLAASGDGLFDENTERIAGDTEESIFRALGIPYKRPEDRD